MNKKILVIRNDKLGDFMLAWPAFAMLKQSMPNCEITALVPAYTAEIARCCPFLDNIIIDCGKNSDKTAKNNVLEQIKRENFDIAINLFSNSYNAFLVWKAKIRYRLAPATKIFQFLYTHRVTQRRSQSIKPEYQYNLDLIRAFLGKNDIPVIEPSPPYLTFTIEELSSQKTKLINTWKFDPTKKWFFIHAGSGGSANNLNLEQYAQIAKGLLEQLNCQIILTAGKNESDKANQLKTLIGSPDVIVYDQNDGLKDFAKSLACADLFIAGSTGPLHLAAALDRPTIGFFPSKRSAKALRWQPINSISRHLAFSPPPGFREEEEMSKIDANYVAKKAVSFLRNLTVN